MAMTRVLVCGSNGFIFSHVVRRLLEIESYFLVGLDRLDPCATRDLQTSIPGKYEFVQGDINDTTLVRQLLKEHDISLCILAAAMSHVDASFTSPYQYIDVNVRGTLSVLNAIQSLQSEQKITTIHISSDEVYGDVCDDNPKHEASILAPTSIYSASKAASELISMAMQKSFNLPVITVRPNNIYGPGQFFEKCVPRFITLLQNKKPITIHGSGEQKRSFLYVDDFFDALMLIIEKGHVGEIYNVASEHEISVNELAEKIAHAMRCQDTYQVVRVQDRPFNDTRYYCCPKKLLALGFTQKTSFEQGLEMTVRWYTEEDRQDYFMGTFEFPVLKELESPRIANVVSNKRFKPMQ